MRSRKAVLNIIISFIFELVTIISGFLLPRLVLRSFGSSTNGITQAVSQFIGYISLLTAGVGGVTMASLYKPLAEKDINKVSQIIKATELFLRKVSKIFLIALLIFAVAFPWFTIDEFNFPFTFSLIIILGIGTFGNYYFGLTYRMLLNADQKQYVIKIVQIIVLVLHTFASVLLINNGFSIHIVKLVSALIYLINPVFFYLYVRKKYKLDRFVEPDNSAISQRWDAFAQQVANFVNDNTDLVLLSIFKNMKEVSVYTVYYLIFNAIRMMINSIILGMHSVFGNMLAKNEKKTLDKYFRLYEFLLHSVSIVLYTSMALLITPFIDIYTSGITDVDYHRPIFGYVISVLGFFIAVRIPYQSLARAAGHFKQTKKGAIIEACLNIVVSLILVIPFGMVGLAIGTLFAMLFRTIQYGIYTSKNILERELTVLIKRYIISFISVLIILFMVHYIPKVEFVNYYSWIINGIIITGTGIIVTFLISILFYKNELLGMKEFIVRIFKKRRLN